MKAEQLSMHRRALDAAKEKYDEKMGFLTQWVGEHAYHTKLRKTIVHPITASMEYAVALLYGEREADYSEAERIIENVLALQDTNPKSDTFGLWSWYAEESLKEMDAPDRNSADFVGKFLLEILCVHKVKISDRLIAPIENACKNACASIVRRNEGVQYTNVAFTDALVTIATGECLADEGLKAYGKDKLERFLAFAKHNGTVEEFNSPTYTMLTIRDIGSFLRLIEDNEARALAAQINELEWKMIAEHFRKDMLQLAAPHSRAYEDYLSPAVLYDIELACEGEASFDCEKNINVGTFWTTGYCPLELRGYFSGEKKPLSTEKIITKGYNYPWFAYAVVANTHHTDKYTLGSYNRSELWNQRRPLMAYIKDEGGEKPFCLRLRCLHDGYDFSSAHLHCAQEEGFVLGAVNFASDRGDTHINLDKAADAEYERLSVSLELEGDMSRVSCNRLGGEISLLINGVEANFGIVAAEFGSHDISYSLQHSDNRLVFEAVLYSGEKKEIELAALEAAYACFYLNLGGEKSEVSFSKNDKYITASAFANGTELKIEAGKRVRPFVDVMYDDRQWKNGVLLEKAAESRHIPVLNL